MAEPATPAKSGKKLADSAVKLEVSTGRIEDSADRRTELAADRTLFAAERTYNAWVRTGLLALASGIGAKALLTGLVPDWLILANGSVLVLLDVLFRRRGLASAQSRSAAADPDFAADIACAAGRDQRFSRARLVVRPVRRLVRPPAGAVTLILASRSVHCHLSIFCAC